MGDVDLASRLSFFLWSTSPDEELLGTAADGRLTDPGVLAQQVERMLADPRAEALATRFAHQWLRLQDTAKNQPEPFFYPDFTGQLRADMVRETELFFDNLVREDLSFLELFDADYSFMNERLARHYGIPGVSGDEFRLVRYPADARRGVMGPGDVALPDSLPATPPPAVHAMWGL